MADRASAHRCGFDGCAGRDGMADEVCDFEDPLEEDDERDVPVVATRRGLARLALVSITVGARFDRRSIAEDPMRWMLAPKRLFDGRAAIDACLDRVDCFRGVLLHTLEAGLDADADEIDALVEGDEDGGGVGSDHSIAAEREDGDGAAIAFRARLYTCRASIDQDGMRIWVLDALIACCVEEARRSFASRHGDVAALDATIVEGFDRKDPYATAFMSPMLAAAVEMASIDPSNRIADGLEVSIRRWTGK